MHQSFDDSHDDPTPDSPPAVESNAEPKRKWKRNGNGNGKKKNGTKRQFTDKQRRSFAVIEMARSVTAGVHTCVEMGVVTRSHFFDEWWKQPAYRAEIERRRDVFFDSMIAHTRQKLRLAMEGAADKMIDMIHDAENERNSLRAAENVLVANGIELGKGTRVNVDNRITVETSQAEFTDRLSKHFSDRFGIPAGRLDG